MKKRILFLSDIDSSHTRKWAVSLAQRGYVIAIFSLRKSDSNWFAAYPEITVYDREGFGKAKFSSGTGSKLSYLKLLPALKEAISLFKPEIVHAHYATSYGLMGVRSGFHPLVISVWGSDIFDFPKASWLNKRLIIYNLNRADHIFSTSHIMKAEVLKYVSHEVSVTPFGVNTTEFSRKQSEPIEALAGSKVIGTVKSLEDKYGIDFLIKAFQLVKNRYHGKVKLVIAGTGTQAERYKQMVVELNLNDDVVFTGFLPQEQVAAWHNRFDIFANLSILDSESFGVSVVEAMACERPVVVTEVGGLIEVVKDGETGIAIPPRNAEEASNAFLRLLEDGDLALKMGKAGRSRVLAMYDWERNLDDVEKLYASIPVK